MVLNMHAHSMIIYNNIKERKEIILNIRYWMWTTLYMIIYNNIKERSLFQNEYKSMIVELQTMLYDNLK